MQKSEGGVIVDNSRYLFRGKRVGNGEWEFGYPVPSAGLDSGGWLMTVMHVSGNTVTSNTYRIDPATVGRCTGLRDKNGKLIFEGDICRQNSSPVDLTQICFGKFSVYDIDTERAIDNVVGWFMKVITTDVLSACEPFCFDRILSEYWIKETEVEIIGNIHDNPELLGGEAQHG